ncbi:RibD family protein [Anabaena sp. FACHB-709]|uniref:Riboflavin-specific deaminase n=2 Tax=Nostocaceae TaxID=1162 RepID=A0A1Z4KL85_ANAVA|nr:MULTISPECIES: RibD family protein [Nostocaceae]BAY69730.1 riboflavin-specific deaminase [Trichormus variabilis NIES-23]HBW33150.1 riboflavin deaminase [Nostoc sp. UBA8866]MBD2175109.1 RibD family protein [Anabaena cylindrica FACHB-318]MBD2266969.1 RibD family protein [Anabaena sp. FACHB-709]MBD2276559.1 RibD family protein [Nostoc sp. PCC 7120 = FACHB-418]
MVQHRPHTTVVLAMSADGKIADFRRSPARFGTSVDKTHLEQQIAASDAVLIGAGTLRAYGTTLTVSDTVLLQQRQQQGKPDQPIHIVITHSANLNPEIRFFQQPIRRWLVTTTLGQNFWQGRSEFERIMVFETPTGEIDTITAIEQLTSLQIARLLVLGGGALIASMLELDLIDEFWLTVCPLILGGVTAPTPVDGKGFTSQLAPHLQLLEVKKVAHEVFLHYRLQR